MKIELNINGKSYTATLLNNPTSRDLYSILPLTVKLTNYSTNEKISKLPRKLTTAGAPDR